MKFSWIAGLITSIGLGIPAGAQTSYAYSCKWVSEVTPDAVIQFTRTNGVGTYSGTLTYRGKRIGGFQEGQSQGYGSHWWSFGGSNDPSGDVIVFRGGQVVRGTAGKSVQGPQRVLLVGLGSSLWYGSNPKWRDMSVLLTAAEGFWRSGSGCRALFR